MSITNGTRFKTYAVGASFPPSDVNSIQDVFGLGKSNIPTTESRTNTAYGALTTPDQVTNVVLPTDGLIAVTYQATWQESVAGAARAAIFVGANQLKVASEGWASPVTQAAHTGTATAALDRTLTSHALGLVSTAFYSGGDPATYGGDVTTGQAVGIHMAFNKPGGFGTELNGSPVSDLSFVQGPCYIFAAAGTYTVSVQFKASSGSVTAKNRKLWCWTLGS